MQNNDKEIRHGQMNLQGESPKELSLFVEEIPVWYVSNGKVCPMWISACEEERNQTIDLMEQISVPTNLQKACKQVVRNGGSSGVDGMTVKELKGWLTKNINQLQAQMLENRYSPQPVRSVRIPKPKGGYRQLGIPTVIDRLVQQAMNQVLTRNYDKGFSPNSYGFRPKQNAHGALRQAARYVEEGKDIVVDIDLEKFFDEVNHHRLIWLLGTRIGDKRVIKLIHRFLKTGIMEGGLCQQRIKGTPQGSPLSPLLSNIVLDELDQELTRRGHCFVRYADDLQIFVGSKASAERVMQGITDYIERKMKLKVNRGKSAIRKCYETNFLGHSILHGGRIGLSKSSEQRLKSKLKKITQRNRGVSLEQILHELKPVLLGWLQYFKHASMRSKMEKLEGWLRRRLKCFRLKQCKRTIGIVRYLRKLGVEKTLCWRTALSGKGWWRLSMSPAISIGMNNKWFSEKGYYSLVENYNRLHRNIL
jgi:RNA-directed DNA polymerase